MKLLVILAAVCAITNGCPSIISKSAWKGRGTKCNVKLNTPVNNVVIHHTEGAFCSSQSACMTQARNIQKYHMDSKGWCDIGYNFLIGEDSNIYEGRGWKIRGAHATSYNPISVGISFFGSFTNRAPNAKALKAAQDLIKCGVSKGFIRSTYTLKGHRNVMSTDCPGNKSVVEG
uniref:Peptidoglycan-recognition protein n=1 Tax=Leptobrachium leishanense TaxID=445787 RepID=A0A8C5PT28_9ANUR